MGKKLKKPTANRGRLAEIGDRNISAILFDGITPALSPPTLLILRQTDKKKPG
jgi:hypothetical protein